MLLWCLDLIGRRVLKVWVRVWCNLEKWIRSLKARVGENCNIILVGSKSDIKSEIPLFDIQFLANKYKILYFETSAKENKGVNEIF